jgi:asparagine synthase (glutamine-hydrolysing)
MCGIAGIVNYKKDLKKTINTLNLSIKNRGPDENGFYFDEDENLALTMTRLSIIGLNDGSQPKVSQDKNIIFFFNGEIYNYKELNKNYFPKLNIKSDTEILLRMYEKFGLNMLNNLNGMFSICIYDKKKKKIFLIRDRFGIKPLYYYKNKNFVFSSEINSIKKVFGKELKISKESVSDYLSLGCTDGKNTIYKNVFKVNPGEYAVYDLKSKNIKCLKWYAFKKKKFLIKSLNEAAEFAEENIKRSLKLWTVSDVPICFLLSGGLDSGILSSIYNKISKERINTFSLGFTQKKLQKWNEINVANTLVKKINSNHKNIDLKIDDLLSKISRMIKILGEPYGGGLPNWHIFQEIAKKSKVAISGTGGDEIFGNYDRYFRFIVGSKGKFDKKLFKLFYFFNKNYVADDAWKNKYLSFNFKKNKLPNKFFNLIQKMGLQGLKKNMSFLDIKTQLNNEFLYITDKFSMAHSLEVRTPYLDHHLVENIYGIPEKYRMSETSYKPLLKKIGKKYLPKEYLNFPKHGFSIPLSIWMRGKLKKTVISYLCKDSLNREGLINGKFYDDYVQKMFQGDNSNIQLIWNVFMLHAWLKIQ